VKIIKTANRNQQYCKLKVAQILWYTVYFIQYPLLSSWSKPWQCHSIL